MAEDVHDSLWYAVDAHPDSVEVLKISADGKIELNNFKNKLSDKISLVCISHVCNETGIIHDLHSIAEICLYRGIPLFCDGAQALGHVPLDLSEQRATYYSFSSHKFGATRGFGGLFIRDSNFDALLKGGNQEGSLRAGTENLPGLAAAVKALELSIVQQDTESKRLLKLAELLRKTLKRDNPNCIFNNQENCLPGLLSCSFPEISGAELAAALSCAGFSVSRGSACHADEDEPSRIIMLMGRSKREAIGTLRISLGRLTDKQAVLAFCQILKKYIQRV